MKSGKLVFVIFALLVAVLPKAEAGVFSDDFDGDLTEPFILW